MVCPCGLEVCCYSCGWQCWWLLWCWPLSYPTHQNPCSGGQHSSAQVSQGLLSKSKVIININLFIIGYYWLLERKKRKEERKNKKKEITPSCWFYSITFLFLNERLG
jgi:hypothetical protein